MPALEPNPLKGTPRAVFGAMLRHYRWRVPIRPATADIDAVAALNPSNEQRLAGTLRAKFKRQGMIQTISTIISSSALIGVVVSLILQARLLRTTQLQAVRMAQVELIKLEIEHPQIVQKVAGEAEQCDIAQRAYFNWRVKFLELGHSSKVVSPASVGIQAAILFESGEFYLWWGAVRHIYQAEATTKLEKDFFHIIDRQYERQSGPISADNSEISPERPPSIAN